MKILSVNHPNKNYCKLKCPSPKIKIFFLCGHDYAVVGFPHPLAPGSAQACQLGEPSTYDGGAIVKDPLFVLNKLMIVM